MAAEFQGQFNEAMREAELDEVKKQLQGVNESMSSLNTNFNPIQTIRDELKGAVEAPVATTPETPVQQPTGDASIQAIVEGRATAPADPLVDLPPPPIDDPSEAIAESLRREAQIEAQKSAAVAEAPEKPDSKVG
jgi:sec-independent protein translocase protein TatB